MESKCQAEVQASLELLPSKAPASQSENTMFATMGTEVNKPTVSVSVCEGYNNKGQQTVWHKQHTYISSQSGSWKSEIMVSAGPLSLAGRWSSFPCVFT